MSHKNDDGLELQFLYVEGSLRLKRDKNLFKRGEKIRDIYLKIGLEINFYSYIITAGHENTSRGERNVSPKYFFKPIKLKKQFLKIKLLSNN